MTTIGVRENYAETADAPATMLAADGETALRRFRGEFVLYARGKESAQAMVNAAAIYVDRARLTEEQGPTGRKDLALQILGLIGANDGQEATTILNAVVDSLTREVM